MDEQRPPPKPTKGNKHRQSEQENGTRKETELATRDRKGITPLGSGDGITGTEQKNPTHHDPDDRQPHQPCPCDER
ncbi:MAG: hypothetical protein PVTTEEND_000686 [Candidatus Fervidibacter sp.]|jgi:hypothetical protein